VAEAHRLVKAVRRKAQVVVPHRSAEEGRGAALHGRPVVALHSWWVVALHTKVAREVAALRKMAVKLHTMSARLAVFRRRIVAGATRSRGQASSGK